MLSAREVIYISFVTGIVFVLSDVSNCVTAAIVNEVKSNCTCGGFSTVTPDPNSTPLLSQAPGLVVQCDENGQNTCKDLCLALATATKAKGPEILCNRLKNADELKLSAFYKVCEVPWTYAGMTADEPLCCFDANVVVCGSATTSVPDKSV